ncbi:pseudouridine synthase, RluA family, partial [gut metagenome]
MRQFTIGENEAGQRFDKYLAKLLREAPKSFFYKMLRKKNITLNGKKATGKEKLTVGDQVKL